MKYSLVNCYSDNNKGDLGIILSTIQMLKKYDKSAVITAVSTYNASDPLFKTEHTLLKQELDVYPSIFGELNIGRNKSVVAKLLKFMIDSLRLLLLLIYPSKFFLSKGEKKTYDLLQSSDFIISKGGSYICDENNFRQKIALIRLLFIFILSFRAFKKAKVVILCQSFGPIYGSIGRKIVNYVFSKCHFIVAREEKCIQEYTYLKYPSNKLIIFNDIAFHLVSKEPKDLFQISSGLCVGVTIKTVSTKENIRYRKMMVQAIEYLISKYSANIYIFPHVTIDDDLQASYEVYKLIKDRYKCHIQLLTNNYTSQELKYLYGKMSFLLSTRLHSAIFGLGEKVLAINIAYQGTKSQGIYNNLQLDNLLLVDYSIDLLKKKIDDLIENSYIYKAKLSNNIDNCEAKILTAFEKIFSYDNNKKSV